METTKRFVVFQTGTGILVVDLTRTLSITGVLHDFASVIIHVAQLFQMELYH
jgi:hypothetical protein